MRRLWRCNRRKMNGKRFGANWPRLRCIVAIWRVRRRVLRSSSKSSRIRCICAASWRRFMRKTGCMPRRARRQRRERSCRRRRRGSATRWRSKLARCMKMRATTRRRWRRIGRLRRKAKTNVFFIMHPRMKTKIWSMATISKKPPVCNQKSAPFPQKCGNGTVCQISKMPRMMMPMTTRNTMR